MQKIILSKAWPNSRNISAQPSATLLPEKCCMRLFWFSFKSIAGDCCGIKLKKLPNLAWNFCTWACAVYSFVCCSQSYSHILIFTSPNINYSTILANEISQVCSDSNTTKFYLSCLLFQYLREVELLSSPRQGRRRFAYFRVPRAQGANQSDCHIDTLLRNSAGETSTLKFLLICKSFSV